MKVNATERPLPPQDSDCEMALLGSMMMSVDVIDEIIPIIQSAEAFYTPSHRHIYAVLVATYESRKAIDLLVITDELRKRELLESVGGQEYLILLAESFAEWANADYYAQIVRTCWDRRRIIEVALKARKQAYSLLENEPADVIGSAIAELESIQGGADDSVREIGEHVLRLAVPVDGTHPAGFVSTGSSRIDFACGSGSDQGGGLERGSLTVIAGRPSMGKTSLGLQIAVDAVAAGTNALFVSVEMSPSPIARRFLALTTNVPLSVIANYSPDDVQAAAANAQQYLNGGKLLITENVRHVRDIVAKAKACARSNSVGLVVIDYIQICKASGKRENRNLEVASMSEDFKHLAVSAGVAVVVLSQLSRESQRDKLPRLGHLRDSGALEQDADIVLFLWPKSGVDVQANKPRQIDLRVEKHRNGAICAFTMTFDPATTRFHEVPVRPVEAPEESLAGVPF